MQPGLVFACLALAMLVRSSEIELGASGRTHALRLRDAAQSHLHESWNLQWIDLGLAEAAMVLALFEISAHPQHDDASVEAALILLDKIIEALRLTVIDTCDPDTLDHSTGIPTVAHPRPPLKQCECTTATWSFPPAWDPSWSEAEVKSEETRRLCWSALILVANHTVARAAEQREPLDLFLVNPSNVCHGLVTHASLLTHRFGGGRFLLPLVPLALPWRISSTPRICLHPFGKRYRMGPLLPQYASLELYRALLGRTPHDRRTHPNCVRYICGDPCSGRSIGCAHLQHRHFTDLHVSRVHFQVSRPITL